MSPLVMRLDERVELARSTYLRVLRVARANPTPQAWRAVLTAAKNLSRAIADATGGERKPAERPVRAPVVYLQAMASPRVRDPWVFRPGADPPSSPRCWRMERAPELTLAWERSRALMAESRRLVDRSRALCAEVERAWSLVRVGLAPHARPSIR